MVMVLTMGAITYGLYYITIDYLDHNDVHHGKEEWNPAYIRKGRP